MTDRWPCETVEPPYGCTAELQSKSSPVLMGLARQAGRRSHWAGMLGSPWIDFPQCAYMSGPTFLPRANCSSGAFRFYLH
jgi:hypothetical protein